jgi:DNA polymerase/3'-5' exonuclease PolX
MELPVARKTAEVLRDSLAPYCARVEIAGSIRRGKPEVKDVELVCVPKWEPSELTDLFGEPELLNRALVWAFDEEAFGRVQWIKPGTSEVIPWEPKRDGKYWRGLLPNGLKLDLFIAQPGNFGAIFLIRTGSAEFSQAIVTHAKRIGKPCREGWFTSDDAPHATPEESDVFDLLGLEYLSPEARTDGSVLRAKR